MAEVDVLYVGVALLLGLALGILVALLVRPRRRAKVQVATHEIVEDDVDEAPVAIPVRGPPARASQTRAPAEEIAFDDTFGVARDEPARAPSEEDLPRPPLPDEPEGRIPTEWAKRALGPVEPGRVRGVCSGCGTALSISRKRPVRIACPVCGRTRVLG